MHAAFPSTSPGHGVPSGARVSAYHCEARYGYVWVALADPLLPIPELPEATDPRFGTVHQFYEVWRCNAFRLMENSFDSAHSGVRAPKTFGNIAKPEPVETAAHHDAGGASSRATTPK